MAEPLTEVQRRILNHIVVYIAAHEYPPSVRELQAAFGYSSPSTVAYQLSELERKGRLIRVHGQSRGLRVVHLEAVEGAS